MTRPQPSAEVLANLKKTYEKSSIGPRDLFIDNSSITKMIIRLLPVDDGETLATCVGTHYLPIADEDEDKEVTAVTCPSFTYGVECPICELSQRLANTSSESLRKLADRIRARTQFWTKVVLRDEDTGENKIKVFRMPKTVFDAVFAIFDEDQDDISHPLQGADVRVSAKGKKLNREYQVRVLDRSKLAPTKEDRLELVKTGRKVDFERMIGGVPEGLTMMAAQLLAAVDPDRLDEADADLVSDLKRLYGKQKKKRRRDADDDTPRKKKKKSKKSLDDEPRKNKKKKKKKRLVSDDDDDTPRKKKKKKKR